MSEYFWKTRLRCQIDLNDPTFRIHYVETKPVKNIVPKFLKKKTQQKNKCSASSIMPQPPVQN